MQGTTRRQAARLLAFLAVLVFVSGCDEQITMSTNVESIEFVSPTMSEIEILFSGDVFINTNDGVAVFTVLSDEENRVEPGTKVAVSSGAWKLVGGQAFSRRVTIPFPPIFAQGGAASHGVRWAVDVDSEAFSTTTTPLCRHRFNAVEFRTEANPVVMSYVPAMNQQDVASPVSLRLIYSYSMTYNTAPEVSLQDLSTPGVSPILLKSNDDYFTIQNVNKRPSTITARDFNFPPGALVRVTIPKYFFQTCVFQSSICVRGTATSGLATTYTFRISGSDLPKATQSSPGNNDGVAVSGSGSLTVTFTFDVNIQIIAGSIDKSMAYDLSMGTSYKLKIGDVGVTGLGNVLEVRLPSVVAGRGYRVTLDPNSIASVGGTNIKQTTLNFYTTGGSALPVTSYSPLRDSTVATPPAELQLSFSEAVLTKVGKYVRVRSLSVPGTPTYLWLASVVVSYPWIVRAVPNGAAAAMEPGQAYEVSFDSGLVLSLGQVPFVTPTPYTLRISGGVAPVVTLLSPALGSLSIEGDATFISMTFDENVVLDGLSVQVTRLNDLNVTTLSPTDPRLQVAGNVVSLIFSDGLGAGAAYSIDFPNGWLVNAIGQSWDAILNPGAAGPATSVWNFIAAGGAAPTATFTPSSGTSNLPANPSVNASLVISFSERMELAASPCVGCFEGEVTDGSGVRTALPVSLEWQSANTVLVLRMPAPMFAFHEFRFLIKARSFRAFNLKAIPASDTTVAFTTESPQNCFANASTTRLWGDAGASSVTFPSTRGGPLLFDLTLLETALADPSALSVGGVSVEVGGVVPGGGGFNAYRDCTGVSLTRVSTASNIWTVNCTVPPGVGANYTYHVSIPLPGLTCRLFGSDIVNFPAPVISNGTLRGVSGTGSSSYQSTTTSGEAVLFNGFNFGDDSSVIEVFYGPLEDPTAYTCAVEAAGTSDTQIRCITAAAGSVFVTNLRFSVVVKGQASALGTDQYSYPSNIPRIIAVSGCETPPGRPSATYRCPTAGGIRLSVSGSAFSPGVTVAVDSAPCGNVERVNTTFLTCILPAGTGTDQNIVASQEVGGFVVQSRAAALISYSPPSISSITGGGCIVTPKGSLAECNRTGEIQLTIKGFNFGAQGTKVLVGGSLCTNSFNVDHNELKCNLPRGSGVDRGVVVFQKNGDTSSSNISVSYELCAPGFVSMGLDCRPCRNGSFSPVAGAPACNDCPIGRFSNISGASKCTDCPTGKFQGFAGQDTCEDCPQGRANGLLAQQSCQACPSGRFTDITSQSLCEECPPGSYSSYEGGAVGPISCELCAEGTFSAEYATVQCSDAPAGFFCNQTGLSTAFGCLPGSFAVGQSQNCTLCSPGFYQDQEQQPNCIACPAGTYTNFSGASACTPCDAGTFSVKAASSACTICPAGTFSTGEAVKCDPAQKGSFVPVNGSTGTIDCAPGFFANVSGLSACYPCTPGNFTENRGAVECKVCPTGQYAGGVNASTCEFCAAGTFQVLTGQSVCEYCPAGWFSFAGRAQCERCELGRFSQSAGSSTCSNCERGRFANTTSSSACFVCGAGTYSSFEGARACEDTPAGTFVSVKGANASGTPCSVGHAAPKGSSTCFACPPGNYAPAPGLGACLVCPDKTYTVKNGSTSCRPCPPEGEASCGGSTIESRANSWVAVEADGSVRTYACPDGYCLEGNECAANRKPIEINILCGECEENYSEWGGECVLCTETNWPLVILFIIASFLLMIGLHASTQKSSGMAKIFFYFVQTALFMLGPLQEWMAWLSLFNLQPTDSTSACVTPLSPMRKMVVGVLVPFVLLLEIMLYMFVRRLTHFCWWRKHRAGLIARGAAVEYVPFDYRPYARTAIAATIFSYTQVSKTVFQVLKCVDVQGESVVYAQPAIRCTDDEYLAALPLFYFMLIFMVIAMPLSMLLWLYRKRQVIASESNDLVTIKVRGPFIRLWGVLFEAYVDHAYWFEVVAIGRRTLLIVLNFILFQYEGARYLGFTVLNLFVFLLHFKVHPFKDPIEDALETISLLSLVLISLILVQYSYPYDSSVEAVLTLLVMIPFSLLVLGYVHRFCRRAHNAVSKAFDNDKGILGGGLVWIGQGTDHNATVAPITSRDPSYQGAYRTNSNDSGSGAHRGVSHAPVQLDEVGMVRAPSYEEDRLRGEEEDELDDVQSNPLYAMAGSHQGAEATARGNRNSISAVLAARDAADLHDVWAADQAALGTPPDIQSLNISGHDPVDWSSGRLGALHHSSSQPQLEDTAPL